MAVPGADGLAVERRALTLVVAQEMKSLCACCLEMPVVSTAQVGDSDLVLEKCSYKASASELLDASFA